MTSQLVGYIKKNSTGDYLHINIIRSEYKKAIITKGKDGTEYMTLVLNASKVRKILDDEQDVTSVCLLME
jgi:hypothetical protein